MTTSMNTNSMNTNTTDDFITPKDIIELQKKNINYNEDLPIFLKEIRDYFNQTWSSSYFINEPINDIDELNKVLLNYPSWGGYYILENSFTAISTDNLDILSEKSKIILGYLYGICLR